MKIWKTIKTWFSKRKSAEYDHHDPHHGTHSSPDAENHTPNAAPETGAYPEQPQSKTGAYPEQPQSKTGAYLPDDLLPRVIALEEQVRAIWVQLSDAPEKQDFVVRQAPMMNPADQTQDFNAMAARAHRLFDSV